jgi:hypothetical protein
MKRICIKFAVGACLVGAAGSASADVTISTNVTQNMNCQAGVCAPTAASATLNINDLQNLLASGNVEVTTTGVGVQANNIVESAGLSWSDAAILTLDAYQSVAIQSSVTVAGTGGLDMLTNDGGGSGGALSFGPAGNVTFLNLSSPLAINGNVYVLVNSVATLAQTGGNGFIALAQGYDASADGTYTASPVQNLSGTFEGLGNTISNFSINDQNPEYVGLFSQIGSGASVSDFGLVNASVTSTDETNLGAGPLAGLSDGEISGAWSSGAVTSLRNSAGGLVGDSGGGTIMNSYSSASVTAGLDGGGGLVGEAVQTTIDNCYAVGEVDNSTTTWVGGLIGSAKESLIENSFAAGRVKGKGNSQGGSYVGGLVGVTLQQFKVENSYAAGKVIGGTYSDVGGLIGDVAYGGRFITSYSMGAVSAGSGSSIGGFIGSIGPTYTPIFENNYWDTDTGGTGQGTGNEGDVDGITGLTTAEFQAGLPDGFGANYWAEYRRIIHGFPYLVANPPPSR